MTRRGIVRIVLAAAFLACNAHPSRAQLSGPQMPARAFEIGIGLRFFDRELSTNVEGQFEPSYHLTAALFRYGVASRLTLSGEVAAANTHALEKVLHENNVNSRYLLTGIGIQARLWSRGRWGVDASWHAARSVWMTQQSTYDSTRDTFLQCALLVERRFGSGPHRYDVWVGPAYENFSVTSYPQYFRGRHLYAETTDNWGAIAGCNALWFGRVDTYLHLVLVQRVQPRAGIAYHFE